MGWTTVPDVVARSLSGAAGAVATGAVAAAGAAGRTAGAAAGVAAPTLAGVPLQVLGEVGRPLAWVGGRLGLTGDRDRRVWAAGEHAHIEAHGVHRAGTEDVRRALTRRLERLDGVRWAEVNAVTRRVVVAFDGGRVELSELVGAVEEAERAVGVRREQFPGDAPDHPADEEPLRRALTELAGDLLGLGVAVAGTASGVVGSSWSPLDLAVIVGLVDTQPRLRERLEQAVGRRPSDFGLAVVGSAAEVFSAGPVGLVVDVLHRADLVWDLRARRRAWCRREPDLHVGRGWADVACPAVGLRPVALPPGPVERTAEGAGMAGLGAFGLALAATRDPRRATGALLTGVPRAARLGREAFAASLGRALAARGAIVLDRRVLRRLDRIDTVLLDGRLLLDGAVDGSLGSSGRVLVASARRGGRRLVVAGPRRRLEPLVDADELVAGGSRLGGTVRRLQREGHGVAVLSADHDVALRSADCGVGVALPGRPPPWCAHILCDGDLDHAAFVLDALEVARRVSRRSATAAVAGSVAGGALALTALPGRSARSGLVAVNAAALASMAAASYEGAVLDRRRRRPVPGPG